MKFVFLLAIVVVFAAVSYASPNPQRKALLKKSPGAAGKGAGKGARAGALAKGHNGKKKMRRLQSGKGKRPGTKRGLNGKLLRRKRPQKVSKNYFL
jgi:hypothetical protein